MPDNRNADKGRESSIININMTGHAQLTLTAPVNYADHGATNTVTTTEPANTDATAKTPFWKSGTFWTAVAALAAVASTIAAFMALK
ncbi:hypothetical protein ACWGKU_33420 [Kitasatospora sp. NPDC054768]